MITRILIAIIATTSTLSYASCTSRQIGDAIFTNCTDGTNFTSRDIGGTTFYSGDITGTSRDINGTTFHSINGVTGTSRNIGDTTFHSLGNETGTSRNIGGTTFNSFGQSNFTCRAIGDAVTCN